MIPKPPDLGFCFIGTASTPKGFGLTFPPQTSPASLAVFMSRNLSQEKSVCSLLIQGVDCPWPLSLFPIYRFFCVASLLDFAGYAVMIYRIGWVVDQSHFTV